MTVRARSRHERGAVLVGTSAGIAVFLVLMLCAVQILFNLYATSMVTAAAHEAGRTVAGFEALTDRCAAAAVAEQQFVEALGDYGAAGHAHLSVSCRDPDLVTVHVVADHPTFLPTRAAGLLALGRVDRTIEVRVEAFR